MQSDLSAIDREPAYAGQFYPGGVKTLNAELKVYFDKAIPPLMEGLKPMAVISPHAGYVFSGKVAASAFNQIPENAAYKKVFIIASSHRYSYRGGAIYTRGDYLTPLGRVKVDCRLGQELIETHDFFIRHDDAHIFEHSLEVQLPFLQHRVAAGFQLVPIVLGTHNPDDCREMAKILEPWFNADNLFIISSDFSHYPDYESAIDTDRKTAEAIVSNSPKQLLNVLQENKMSHIPGLATSLCGWTSVLTLLYITADKPVTIKKIDYQNSGDNTRYGDRYRVVGYQALAVFGNDEGFFFSEKEKRELIGIARQSVEAEIKHLKNRPTSGISSGNLSKKAGAFVSIYTSGKLRGCIGSFESDRPLSEVVRKMAVSASRDSRFDSLSLDDLNDFTVEISVLTPLKRIYDPSEIVIGKHGIYIRKDYYSGTFLPQVAVTRNWSVAEFLGRCSRDKAGLGWDGWKNADLYTYEAIIIKD